MADFIIPKGKAFIFNIKVIEKDSLLPQDVEFLDTVNSTIEFINPATNVCIMPEAGDPIVIARIPDNIDAVPLTYLNGNISVTIPASYTSKMVSETGDKVDGYYLKPTYKCIFNLVFTDATPSRVVVIDKVYVTIATCS